VVNYGYNCIRYPEISEILVLVSAIPALNNVIIVLKEEEMVRGGLLLVLFPIFCLAIDDFIDTFEPVIRRSPENITTIPNDLFGYSLVLHKLVADGNVNDTR